MAIISTNEIADGRSASEVVEQCPSCCTAGRCYGSCSVSRGKELEGWRTGPGDRHRQDVNRQ